MTFNIFIHVNVNQVQLVQAQNFKYITQGRTFFIKSFQLIHLRLQLFDEIKSTFQETFYFHSSVTVQKCTMQK